MLLLKSYVGCLVQNKPQSEKIKMIKISFFSQAKEFDATWLALFVGTKRLFTLYTVNTATIP